MKPPSVSDREARAVRERRECADRPRGDGDQRLDDRGGERLIAPEDCYRLLFEHHPQPMGIYEPVSLRFVDVNEAAVALYGYTRAELLGMTVRELSLWQAAADAGPCLADGEPSLQKHVRKDGTPIDVEVSSRAIPSRESPPSTSPLRLLAIRDQTDRLRGETERKILEAQFHHAQKLEPVGRLASGIAQDINNLLTILLGYSDWLESREGLDPRSAEAAREIHQVSASASMLVRQLLAFNEAVRPPIVNVNDALTGRTDDAPAMLRTPGGDEWILVVEDDARLRSLAEQILATRGYHVLGAANAREALELIDTYGSRLSLLLTDVVMPGMNGRDLANRALKACPALSVIYMSGYTDAGAIPFGRDTPQAFLGKPFTAVDLLELVRSTLDVAQARARVNGW
jgi:PAS domain S-box-containing protein